MRVVGYRIVKRLLDVVGVLIVGVLFAPLMILIAFGIALSMGRPVLFRQPRGGLGGRVFDIFKFRTMRDACGADGHPLPDSERLTRFGNFLRSSSLDELPELWNVLVGDMSFVGPRPFMAEYLPLYTSEQARRHLVRPGLTGWAQINGRNAISWEDRFELDLWYVDNCSLLLDAKIIVLTFVTVLHRRGVSAEGEATMPKFTGPKLTGASASDGDAR
jgi:lipopolysaccharide/colanic/teichoic acid biosynthesis glycosyltransferase